MTDIKLTRLIATIIAAATAIAPFSLNIPTGTVFAGSSTLDAESFFVYVGTYGGSSSQFRYLYQTSDGSYNANKVVWEGAPTDLSYGDIFTASGKASMTKVYPAADDPANSHVCYYSLDEGNELDKAGNCSDLMEKKDLTVTSKIYDGSSHWSVRYADGVGETYYYGLSSYRSSLLVDPLDCEVGDVYTYALFNDYMVIPLAKQTEKLTKTMTVEVVEINNTSLLVKPADRPNSEERLTLPKEYLDNGVKASVGMKLEVTFSGEILETYPEQFANITKVTVVSEKNDLLPGQVRITLVDADTNEPIIYQNDSDSDLGYLLFRECDLGDSYFENPSITDLKTNPYIIQFEDLSEERDYTFHIEQSNKIKNYSILNTESSVVRNENNSYDLIFKLKYTPTGDINDDGKFTVADLVLLNKWLLAAPDTEQKNWKAADFFNDNVLDIFDLCSMRKALVNTINIPVALSITETGGYDGVHRVWNVYTEDGEYILSYDDQNSYVDTEPIVVKISEADYREIMSLNYDQIIDEYNKTPREQVWDGFNYKTVITYGNGEEIETRADMSSVLVKLEKLLDKYLNPSTYVKPDREILYGAPIRVVADKIPLYQGPDNSYGIITTIPQNTTLTELGVMNDNNNWAFVKFNGQYGWIQMVTNDGETQYIVDYPVAAKPVIYLYPENETDVHVELELTEAELSTTYPKYNDGWDVVAYPDGTILNKADGSHHRYLFWDAVNCRTIFDLSKGFCVAGSDTESFLKEKLAYMGLTEDETNEFIVYWLPLMEHNKYNLISFQSDVYTDSAKLNITPAPDSMLRVFMTFVPLENSIDIEPQQLSTFERTGFTVVEWGGSKIQ